MVKFLVQISNEKYTVYSPGVEPQLPSIKADALSICPLN